MDNKIMMNYEDKERNIRRITLVSIMIATILFGLVMTLFSSCGSAKTYVVGTGEVKINRSCNR